MFLLGRLIWFFLVITVKIIVYTVLACVALALAAIVVIGHIFTPRSEHG